MNAELLFPSKYLKAANLGGKRYTLNIRKLDPKVELKMVGGKTEVKPVIYFYKLNEDGSRSNVKKGLVLNRTNALSIVANHGNETDEWIDKEVVLYTTKVPFGDRIVPAIRIEEPEPEAPAGEDLFGEGGDDGLGEGEAIPEEVPLEAVENGDGAEGDILA